MAVTARSRQKEETRRELYRIALEVIRRDGLQAAGIDEIARRAGVSRGTFYFHFPTKDHVVAALLRTSRDRLAEALLDLPADAPLSAVLQRACEAMTREWEGEPRLFVEAGLLGLRQAGTGQDTRENDPARRALGERFHRTAKELKSPLPPEVLADVLLLDLLVAGMAWAGDPKLDLLATLQAVTHLFLDGVRPRR